MAIYQKFQRPGMFRTPHPVEVFALILISVVLGYSIFIPWSWTRSEAEQWIFWQTHALIFLGCASINTITLRHILSSRDKRYVRACICLLVANILTIIASLFDISAYNSFLSLSLYVVLYSIQSFALIFAIPVQTFPQVRLFRLIAFSTLVSLVTVGIALQALLPQFLSNLVWSSTAVAMQFRMALTVTLCCLYISLYQYFGYFRGRVVLAAGLGLIAMLCTDILFTIGTFHMIQGGADSIYSLAIPFWDVHQITWAIMLYWAAKRDLQWYPPQKHNELPKHLGLWVFIQQSVLLVVLLLFSSNLVQSLSSSVWLIGTVLVYQTMMMLEREQLIQEQQKTHDQLIQAQQQVEQLAQQAAVASERSRISRDLHTIIGANLSAIWLHLEAAAEKLHGHPARESVVHAQRAAHDLLAEARRKVHNLAASVAAPVLHERIEVEVQADRAAGLRVDLHPLGTPRRLPPTAEEALFRAAQEGITNMRRHAQATQVVIDVDYRDPSCVWVTVHDNGRGALSTTGTGGSGLAGMRAQLQAIGGDMQVETVPSHGFKLTAMVPA